MDGSTFARMSRNYCLRNSLALSITSILSGCSDCASINKEDEIVTTAFELITFKRTWGSDSSVGNSINFGSTGATGSGV